MLIRDGTIRVRKYEGQADMSAAILETFAKFRQGGAKDYRRDFLDEPHAVHVEAAVLDMVADLYRDTFHDLDDFCATYAHFDDRTVLRFSREIQFYLSWLEFISPLRQAGLPFCYPALSGTAGHIFSLDGFDAALARIDPGNIVTNDFRLDLPERIIVVTGPNQGGKTTFARAFGQIHYLASLGLCVPGREASLYLFDRIYTHFGHEEDPSTLNGKLLDDLVRLRAILDKATGRSIIIVNEIFASTTLPDALAIGGFMMDMFESLGAPTVIVSFLDELAVHRPETVSMMSTVSGSDATKRTFKIVRKPPDGLAYALHLAEKHNLTYELLSGRLSG
jgi:DNA mismatch repair ATPase MutS